MDYNLKFRQLSAIESKYELFEKNTKKVIQKLKAGIYSKELEFIKEKKDTLIFNYCGLICCISIKFEFLEQYLGSISYGSYKDENLKDLKKIKTLSFDDEMKISLDGMVIPTSLFTYYKFDSEDNHSFLIDILHTIIASKLPPTRTISSI